MVPRFNYSGLVIAGIGFFLTRFTVTLAITEEPIRFYLVGIIPLTMGLGLAAFGVALTIADVDPRIVRTTAVWCIIGAGTMMVLAFLTLLGSSSGEVPTVTTIRSSANLSNFLIGGSVGGTLTGLYAARNREHRSEIERYANRLKVLNRMLRHEVLNAVTVIRGYASENTGPDSNAVEIIQRRSDEIETTVEDVRFLTERPGDRAHVDFKTDLGTCLVTAIDAVNNQYPEATISVDSLPQELHVRADNHLQKVFIHLLENAIVHAATDEPTVKITVSVTESSARVSISDEGPGLPDAQQGLLEEGDISEYDDVSSGFGLNIVRLLIDRYRGTIETSRSGGETTITVSLPRADTGAKSGPSIPTELSGLRGAVPDLLVTMWAAVIAGVFYGIASELQGGSVAGIGVFYGAAHPMVGWITHEFHSIVFGFMYAGWLSAVPSRFRDSMSAHLAIGVVWALALWIGAAGVIAPVWLVLLGIPVPIPNLTSTLFISHLAWGISLAVLTSWGYDHVAPWLARYID